MTDADPAGHPCFMAKRLICNESARQSYLNPFGMPRAVVVDVGGEKN